MIDAVLLWIHIIAVLIWIGGMLYTLFILRPSLSVIGEKKGIFMKSIMDKFFPLVWIAIATLILTEGYKAHYFISSPLFILKLVIYIVMVINFSYIYFGLYKKLPSAENKQEIMAKITTLIKVNFTLGIVIILLIELVRFGF
ncbi:MAG: hypothetical protein DSY47_07180 [Hydrogenothermus sp.]|nr:MAG: hypothetical protein DSY47_07180 [Hydrogenothermus sp.]